MSADSISSALLVGLREEGRKEEEEEGGRRRIIFKFIGRIGRIEGLGVLILSQCLAIA